MVANWCVLSDVGALLFRFYGFFSIITSFLAKKLIMDGIEELYKQFGILADAKDKASEVSVFILSSAGSCIFTWLQTCKMVFW